MRKRLKEEDLVLSNVNTDLDRLGVDILVYGTIIDRCSISIQSML